MLSPAISMTILTVFTFVLGAISKICQSYTIFFVSLAIVIAIPYVIPQFNHLLPRHLLECVMITFVFGLLDAYFWNHGDFDMFGIFIWITTVRFYFQFQLINCFHHFQLNSKCFLIYHSGMYFATNIFLTLEHLITRHLLKLSYKQSHPLMIPALVLTLLAMGMRILAFFTAKSNFTHLVSYKKKKGHVLVTHGIYAFFRHPSYTGFYYYAIFSMIMIGNFVSAILFACMLSVFFNARIKSQQHMLVQFFGNQYVEYRKRTWVLIPYFRKNIQEKLEDFM